MEGILRFQGLKKQPAHVRGAGVLKRNEERGSCFAANLEDARAEAERLSRKEKAIFFVLEMVGYAEPQDPPIMWVEIAGRGRSVTMI